VQFDLADIDLLVGDLMHHVTPGSFSSIADEAP
jgi:hypothetical protein